MNQPLYLAAIRAGCTHRQSEVVATMVETRKLAEAAQLLGIAESTAKNHLVAVRQRLGVPHSAAIVARLLT